MADFQLGATGSLSGTVRADSNQQGIPGVTLQVRWQNYPGIWDASAVTDTNGHYQIDGLPHGDYRVYTDPLQPYQSEAWDDHVCLPNCAGYLGADPVTVPPGGATPPIDFGLGIGAVIAGNVHDDGQSTLAYSVGVRLAQWQNNAWETVGSDGVSPAQNHFQFDGLVAGTYAIFTLPGYDWEVYDNVPCPSGDCQGALSGATQIALGGAQVINDIDIGLNPAASISGRVTDLNGGAGLPGVSVVVYERNDAFFTVYQAGQIAVTDAQGYYGATHLSVPSSFPYRVHTLNTSGYLDQYYQGFICSSENCPWQTSNSVALAPDQQLTGLNFLLLKAGGLSGRARSADADAPAAGATVYLYNSLGDFYRGENYQFLKTNNDGSYSTYGLPNGTYYALLSVTSGPFAGSHLYGGPSCLDGQPQGPCDPLSAGAPIVITNEQALSGIDFFVSDGDVLFKSGFE